MHTIGTPNYTRVLFAVSFIHCIFDYNRFILIDVGQVGRFSDGGVFSNCAFGQALEDGELLLPNPACLSGTGRPELPYVMVGDEAFPLRNYLLRPYPGCNLPGDFEMIFGMLNSLKLHSVFILVPKFLSLLSRGPSRIQLSFE